MSQLTCSKTSIILTPTLSIQNRLQPSRRLLRLHLSHVEAFHPHQIACGLTSSQPILTAPLRQTLDVHILPRAPPPLIRHPPHILAELAFQIDLDEPAATFRCRGSILGQNGSAEGVVALEFGEDVGGGEGVGAGGDGGEDGGAEARAEELV
jgi:hypothetical protein